MWTLICMILMIYVFVKMVGLAIRMSWGILKILVNLVLFPALLVGLVIAGFVSLVLPIVMIAGIIVFVLSR